MPAATRVVSVLFWNRALDKVGENALPFGGTHGAVRAKGVAKAEHEVVEAVRGAGGAAGGLAAGGPQHTQDLGLIRRNEGRLPNTGDAVVRQQACVENVGLAAGGAGQQRVDDTRDTAPGFEDRRMAEPRRCVQGRRIAQAAGL